jgi:peptidyl-prolyl cis-trans isomerase A (cyclophilin A)
MKIPALCLSLTLIALSAAAQTPATPKPATSQATTGTHPTTTHRMTTTTDPALLHPATLKAKAPDVYEATFVTTRGNFVIQVTRAWAPLGADRFYNLVKHGFYNGNPFFRIVMIQNGYIVQFGLSGNPAVNTAWEDANFPDDRVTQSNLGGFVTFAKTAAPNSRTTQLFINLGDNPGLDSQGFAPFGKVISGMDVLNSLYRGYGENPDQDQIRTKGTAYFSKQFPNLDLIKTATITSPAPTAAPTRSTTSGAATHHTTTTPSGGTKPTQ